VTWGVEALEPLETGVGVEHGVRKALGLEPEARPQWSPQCYPVEADRLPTVPSSRAADDVARYVDS